MDYQLTGRRAAQREGTLTLQRKTKEGLNNGVISDCGGRK
jgi:hypothetical protein